MLCSYYYGLCTTEKQFHRELRKMNIDRAQWPEFIANEQSNATTHFFECNDKRAAIVCMPIVKDRLGVEIAGLLVHEAVHIWQAHRDDIGEKQPASEQEAYGIQWIAQTLIHAYGQEMAA
jgi:hypothetical protein